MIVAQLVFRMVGGARRIHTSSLRCSLLKHIRACCEPWEMDYSKAFQRIPIEPPADVPQPRWEGFRNDAVELLDKVAGVRTTCSVRILQSR